MAFEEQNFPALDAMLCKLDFHHVEWSTIMCENNLI